MAALHGAVSAAFLVRRGVVDPFGLLAAAYGVALASTAIPLVAGATLTTVVWASEAAALAVVAGRRAHGPSLISAVALLGVAAARIVLQAGEALQGWAGPRSVAGPDDPLLAALLFFLAAAAVFVVVVPVRPVRLAVVGIAVLACLPVVPVQVSGLAAVTTWTALAVLAASSPRWLAVLPSGRSPGSSGRPSSGCAPPTRQRSPSGPCSASAGFAGALALLATAVVTLLTEPTPWPQTAGLPFTDEAGLCALGSPSTPGRGYLVEHPSRGTESSQQAPFVGVAALAQLTPPWSVVLWTGLALLAAAVATRDPAGWDIYAPASVFALVSATLGTALVTSAGATPWPAETGHLPFADEAGACAVVLAVGYLVAGYLLGTPETRPRRHDRGARDHRPGRHLPAHPALVDRPVGGAGGRRRVAREAGPGRPVRLPHDLGHRPGRGERRDGRRHPPVRIRPLAIGRRPALHRRGRRRP